MHIYVNGAMPFCLLSSMTARLVLYIAFLFICRMRMYTCTGYLAMAVLGMGLWG